MDSSNSSNPSVEKCTCEKVTANNYPTSLDNSSDGSISGDATSKDKKMKISLTSLGLNFRRGRSKRGPAKSKVCNSESSSPSESDKKSSSSAVNKWTLRFNLPKKQHATPPSASPSSSESSSSTAAAEPPPPDPVKLCQMCTTKSSKELLDEPGPSNAPQPATTWTGGAGLLFCAHNISSSSESTNVSQIVISDSESTPDVLPQSIGGEMSFNDSESESGKEKEVVTQSQQQEAMENPLPPPPQQEGERTRGIYGIHGTSNCIILNGSWDMHWIRTVHEDCDEAARLTRAREIEQGVEAPANFKPVRRIQLLCSNIDGEEGSRRVVVYPGDVNVDSLKSLFHDNVTLQVSGLDSVAGCHTQVDFIHCLVPDMYQITQCSFYWGKMDRYEAERLLDGKPEGTFLLRDSAQEEFLFSVSFRKYSRSLHARVEQWNHKFSFDAHDPGVFTSDTVCGLMEHYKDPSSCMFFEPMLSFPLNRNFPFSLQHLCRSVIVNRVTYDSIKELNLPKTLKSYLKEYHYKQKVRVERFDDDIQYYDRSSSKDSGGMMANGKLL